MPINELDKGEAELFLQNASAFGSFLKSHPHEAAEVAFLETILEPGMKAIDVGANIGVTSIAIAKQVGAKGNLYAFEPHPRYFAILKENLASNRLSNVSAFEVALTDKVGKTDFYKKERSSGIVSAEGAQKIEASCTTIDRFLNEQNSLGVDIINMDCEGSELLVLRGAEKTLRMNTVKIFCEIHHDFLRQLGQSVADIIVYLHNLGYEVHSFSPDKLQIGNDFDRPEYIYGHN
jgi:FkbM family methyltransferase